MIQFTVLFLIYVTLVASITYYLTNYEIIDLLFFFVGLVVGSIAASAVAIAVIRE